jgi:hypothetical protein
MESYDDWVDVGVGYVSDGSTSSWVEIKDDVAQAYRRLHLHLDPSVLIRQVSGNHTEGI